jgi:hypothetical protein
MVKHCALRNAYSMFYVNCASHHLSKTGYAWTGKFLTLHTMHILKTTLAHTTGFTEWFITHTFLNIMIQGRSLAKAVYEMRWSWYVRSMGYIPNMAMCIYSIFGYVLWFFWGGIPSWCGLYLGCFVTLIPLPSWSFGFDSIGLYNVGANCLNLEVLFGPYTPNPFENF